MTRSIAAVAGLLLAVHAFAQAPGGPPPGSTGMCNDGSYTKASSRGGACADHKGVKDWYVAATPTPVAPRGAQAGAPVPPGTPRTTPAPVEPSRGSSAADAGGQVWVNTASNVYHCPGDRWYGKTKAGRYMSEAAAKQAGAHADHGKACT